MTLTPLSQPRAECRGHRNPRDAADDDHPDANDDIRDDRLRVGGFARDAVDPRDDAAAWNTAASRFCADGFM